MSNLTKDYLNKLNQAEYTFWLIVAISILLTETWETRLTVDNISPSKEKVIVTVDHHGNTSAASIPLALSENIESGRIKKGDLLVLTAMGAGFTWGGALVRF